jgi:hypothetical protein
VVLLLPPDGAAVVNVHLALHVATFRIWQHGPEKNRGQFCERKFDPRGELSCLGANILTPKGVSCQGANFPPYG